MMKLFGSMVLLICMFCLPTFQLTTQADELQPGTAIGINYPIKIRSEQTVRSDTLLVLENWELLNVIEIDGIWAYVEFEGIMGWVACRDLINATSLTPLPLGYHQMAYDIDSDRMILFGGFQDEFSPVNDTWAYHVDSNTWERMNPLESPAPGEGPMAYDSESDRMIYFLGTIGWPPQVRQSQTWAYDYNMDTWTRMHPETSPPSLLGARMVYDSESDRMILFGGLDSSKLFSSFDYMNETWTYDYNTDTWIKMNPEISPRGTNYHPMTYDAMADKVILLRAATWVYDYNSDTWEKHEIDPAPRRRDYSTMIYIPTTGQSILFGAGEAARDDTWVYDYDTNTWSELELEVAPSKRGWHSLAYSDTSESVILFGGGSRQFHFTSEVWLFDPMGQTWMYIEP